MTTATREALEQVNRILHEAGWDNPTPSAAEVTDRELEALRTAYAGSRGDHLELLRRTLGAGERVEDVGRGMGLPPEQARSLFREALDRLRARDRHFVNRMRRRPGSDTQSRIPTSAALLPMQRTRHLIN